MARDAQPQVVNGLTIGVERQLDDAVKRIEALEEKEARRAVAEAEAAAVGEQSTIGSLPLSTATEKQKVKSRQGWGDRRKLKSVVTPRGFEWASCFKTVDHETLEIGFKHAFRTQLAPLRQEVIDRHARWHARLAGGGRGGAARYSHRLQSPPRTMHCLFRSRSSSPTV